VTGDGRRPVLVVGGTGATGRLIVADLAAHCPGVPVDVAGRRPGGGPLPAGARRVALDVDDEARAREVFAGYRLVVLALGPFEIYGGRVHRLCLEAGAHAVDVNDSYEAAERVVDLDGEARERGLTVATGMGLTPGLSTLLLMMLLKGSDRGRELRVRLWMGAKNGGGAASPWVLLANFRPRVAELAGGRIVEAEAEWSGGGAVYDFPGRGPAPVFHYSSPEALTLARSGAPAVEGVARLNHKYHVQFLPRAMGRAFAALPLLRSEPMLRFYSRLLHRMHPLTRRLPGSSATTVLAVEAGAGADFDRLTVASELSSYYLTASFAGAFVELLLGGELPFLPGVHGFEAWYEAGSPLLGRLERRRIEIERQRGASAEVA
jgi:Saccharopine dehydrogenase NADP binding domain